MKNKKYFIHFIILLICILSLAGCGEQICSYCGEEKICKEYDILGTTRYICSTCMSNPNASSSGNVIWDYTSDLVDPELYVPSVNNAEENMEETNSEEADPFADLTIEKILNEDSDIMAVTTNAPDTNISNTDTITDVHLLNQIGENGITTDNQSVEMPDTIIATPVPANNTKTSVFDTLSTLLAKDGYTLVKDPEKNNIYRMTKGDSDQKILFDFSKDDNGNDKLIISMEADGNESVHVNACINGILSFIGSSDYNDLGYDIYTNAHQYGNYNYGNNNFYYILSSQKELESGLPPVRFEIISH